MHRFARSLGAVVVAATIGFAPFAAHAMGNHNWNESADERMKQAVAAIENKDYVGAINLLKEIVSDDDKNADAHNYLGYSYRKIGSYQNALLYYKKALAVKPDHRGANEYIGEAYLEMKQPDKAKPHLDRLAKICGPSCDEYKQLKKAFDDYQAKGKQS